MNLVPKTNEEITLNHVIAYFTIGGVGGIMLERWIKSVLHRRTTAHKTFPGVCCR